ncbi:MAG: archease [Anaerolineae bacterium]
MGHWEELEHTADLALRVWGDDLADLFATTASGMFAHVGLPDRDSNPFTHKLELSAPDVETLLVDWLNELLYLHETRRRIFTEYRFEAISRSHLRATAEAYPIREYRTHIKAATFHCLEVEAEVGGYRTDIVFDV